MAKYLLSRENSVSCAVLDENCLANTYTVKFKNGVIKNVDKRRVRNLDRIDEGVLDRLKDVGNFLLDKVLKPVGRYVYMVINGIKHSTLFNTMIMAESRTGMGFYPSESFAKVCEGAGIEPSVTEDTTAEEAEIKLLNAYWKNQMDLQDVDASDVELATESYKVSTFANRNLHRLNEAITQAYSLEGAAEGWDHITTNEAIRYIYNQYVACVKRGAGKRTATQPLTPICLWGAPGIGKTSIIKSLVKNLNASGAGRVLNGGNEGGKDVSIIYINAMTMRKDDFSFPTIKDLNKALRDSSGRGTSINIKSSADVIKSFLPAYSLEQVGEKSGDFILTEDILDDIANGGDGSGNGLGGIIFIDELSRVAKETMDVLMLLVQQRQIGNYFIGSKWVFAAAANGIDDMGDNGEEVSWEAAYTGRFECRRYVPTYQEWRAWASAIGPDGRTNIEQIYIDFLDENYKTSWYNPNYKNNTTDDLAATLYTNPRSYGLATASYRQDADAYDAYLDNEDEKSAADLMGFGDEYGRRLSSKEKSRKAAEALRRHGGNKLEKAFNDWNNFDARFTAEIAKKAWTTGSIGSSTFVVDRSNADRAVDKIIENHPKYVKNNGSNIVLTPKEYENIMKCIDELSSAVTEIAGSKESTMKEMKKRLFVRLSRAPFDMKPVDLENDPTYANGNEIYNRAIGANGNTIAKSLNNLR